MNANLTQLLIEQLYSLDYYCYLGLDDPTYEFVSDLDALERKIEELSNDI